MYREITVQTERGRLVLAFTSERALHRFAFEAMQAGYATEIDSASIKTYSKPADAMEALRDFGEPGEAPRHASGRDICGLLNREAAALERRAEAETHPVLSMAASKQAEALRHVLGRVTANNAGIRTIGPEGD